MRLALLIGVCSLAALADNASLTGPVPGFVFDRSSHSIRPIYGVPGSSYLGPAVLNGVDAAAISPLGRSALVIQAGQLNLVRNLDSSQPSAAPISGAISAVSRISWGRDGASAAVYATGSQQAQFVRNLNPRDLSQPPSVEDPIDLSSISGAVSASSFDGKRLLLGTKSQDSGGGIYLADGQSPPRLLAQAANPIALSLDSAKGDLYFADRDTNQIWMVRDYAGDATPMLFADERAGVSSPVGVRVTADRRLLINNSGSRGIDALDIETRASLAHVDLDFAPHRLEQLGAGSLSLLNFGAPDGPLYVLDDRGGLAVYFVPAGGSQ
jgi:hypothetical protein